MIFLIIVVSKIHLILLLFQNERCRKTIAKKIMIEEGTGSTIRLVIKFQAMILLLTMYLISSGPILAFF